MPHWRADEVLYYLNFRHKRSLSFTERSLLFKALLQSHGKKWNLSLIAVLNEYSEIIVNFPDELNQVQEISKILEPIKKKVSSRIQKLSGEKWPVFYFESYDRIIRDLAEYENKFQATLEAYQSLFAEEEDGENQLLWTNEQENFNIQRIFDDVAH